MTIPEPYLGLGIALGLGLLVGLQRQHAGSAIAGVRTFALITLLGAAAGLLTAPAGGWPIAAGLVAIAAVAWVGNINRTDGRGGGGTGVTTEAAMLLMFLVGALVTLDQRPAAVIIGAACAVLLQLKTRLHRLATWLTDEDLRAIMQFVAVSLIVLPVLPDKDMGPFDALNPRNVWFMVVLVVGISLAGYLAHRILGPRRGMLLGGLFAGLVSSTATTVSYSRAAKSQPNSAAPAAAAIALASTVLYPRVAVELAVIAPSIWTSLAWPLGVMFVLSALMSGLILLACRRQKTEINNVSNPSQLKNALFFAALFAIVSLATAAATHYWGQRGTIGVAALSGLTDLDAITLTVGKQAHSGSMPAAQASAAVLIAIASNTLFKFGIVCVLGNAALRRHIWWYMAATAAGAATLAGLLLSF
ncbi:MAG: MgtC/SapB family protein [Phycisphaerales bacterium]